MVDFMLGEFYRKKKKKWERNPISDFDDVKADGDD